MVKKNHHRAGRKKRERILCSIMHCIWIGSN